MVTSYDDIMASRCHLLCDYKKKKKKKKKKKNVGMYTGLYGSILQLYSDDLVA
jgi:hypothetical protein